MGPRVSIDEETFVSQFFVAMCVVVEILVFYFDVYVPNTNRVNLSELTTYFRVYIIFLSS